MNDLSILLSPAHYCIADGVSEYGWPYKIVENIKNDFNTKFFILTNYFIDKMSIDDNTIITEFGKNGEKTNIKTLNFYIKCYLKSLDIINNEDIDIIHHMLPFSYEKTFNLLTIFNLKRDIPFILGPLQNPTFSGTIPIDDIIVHLGKPILKKLFIKTVERADKLIVINEFTKKLYERYVPTEKIVIIPPGIDVKEFSFRDFDSLSTFKEILYVGQLIKRKGVDYLIRAFQIVSSVHKDVILRIIGTGTEFNRLKRLTEELNISNKVIFEGYISHKNLKKYYEKCEFVVLPSLSESFGQVILEGMACGRPCIASNIVGPNDIIIHGKTGYLFPSKDIYMLTKYISMLIDDEKLCKEMGKNSRILVEKKYDWKLIGKSYYEIYKNSSK